jgi:hypothetical protein
MSTASNAFAVASGSHLPGATFQCRTIVLNCCSILKVRRWLRFSPCLSIAYRPPAAVSLSQLVFIGPRRACLVGAKGSSPRTDRISQRTHPHPYRPNFKSVGPVGVGMRKRFVSSREPLRPMGQAHRGIDKVDGLLVPLGERARRNNPNGITR